jgi:hypothetical protein
VLTEVPHFLNFLVHQLLPSLTTLTQATARLQLHVEALGEWAQISRMGFQDALLQWPNVSLKMLQVGVTTHGSWG